MTSYTKKVVSSPRFQLYIFSREAYNVSDKKPTYTLSGNSKEELINLLVEYIRGLRTAEEHIDDKDFAQLLKDIPKQIEKDWKIGSFVPELNSVHTVHIVEKASDSKKESSKEVKEKKSKKTEESSSRSEKKSSKKKTSKKSSSSSEEDKKKKKSSKKKGSKKSSSSSSDKDKKSSKKKGKKNNSSNDEEEEGFVETICLTYGECSENRAGNEMIGVKAKDGFNHKDLKLAKAWFEEKGITCELVCLNDFLTSKAEKKTSLEADKAYILIARNGLSAIVNPNELYAEQKTLAPDTKAWGKGKVVNLHARYALCFADKGHKADYEEKQGTVIAFKKVPLLNKVREELPRIIGRKADKLTCEGNYYYDADKCYISNHGDAERKRVIAVRLGKTFRLAYTWFYNGVPISEPIEFFLNHGDMYIMSEKAVGDDWKLRTKAITIRHSAGRAELTDWKPKKKKSTK